MFKSVFTRLFLNNIIIVFVSLATFLSAMIFFILDYVDDRQFEMDLKAAQNIENMTIVMQIENPNYTNYRIYNNLLMQYSEFTESDITVVNALGEVYATTAGIQKTPKEYNKKILGGETIRQKSDFNGTYNKKIYVVGMPIVYRGSVVGGIYFNSEIPNFQNKLGEYSFMFMIAGIMAVIIGCAISYIQSRRITKPIKEINKIVLDIASGDFSRRITSDSDEIGQLASSFNYMADSLERLEKTRRSFVSDISHELRTPMTSISGFIGGILDGTIPKEKQDEYLKIAYDESVRLTKLANDMLEMTKMQSSGYKLDVTEFDVNELIRICIIQLGQKIDDKNLEIDVQFENEKMLVVADKDAIKRVIINILDNAVKFSYSNTKIIITSKNINKHANISVGNFGAGIDKNEIGNVFERFYKTDKSRSDDKKGVGLGMSFAKNIINLHKQKIWVESVDAKDGTDTKYTQFTFTLELS
ncbi:MAG: HAMP domain-containing protein [Clostridia bacterium]|nr:HAMP domain-containing protein [Clostridia bacterium]